MTTFSQLTDTPSSFAGQAGRFVRVTASENALEFVGIDLTVDNVASLAALAPELNAVVHTRYAITGNGSGGGTYDVVAATGTPDGFGRVLLANGRHAVLRLVNGGVDVANYGFTGDGTLADTAKINAALAYINTYSGGEVRITKPGTYLLTNTNPYNPADWGGVSEAAANWWANRRAIWMRFNNVNLRLATGVKLKLAVNANCHAIQFGQFPLDIGVTGVDVMDTHVLGNGWEIDMSAVSQIASTATHNHPAGIITYYGKRLSWGGGHIYDSTYYGMAVEGGDIPLRFAEDCHIYDMRVTNCLADGFDSKDGATANKRNVLERTVITNCGHGGSAFLTPQAGIDVRGGWTVNDCSVVFTDGYTSGRVAFRGQQHTTAEKSIYPSKFINCKAYGNGTHAETIGFRLIGRGIDVLHCTANTFSEGIRASAPNTYIQDVIINSCGIGARFLADASSGWSASDSYLVAAQITGCTVGWRIDGVPRMNITGGYVDSNTTPLINTGTSLRIKDVRGFTTSLRAIVAIPVSSLGVQTVAFTHGLPSTPNLSDVLVTLQHSGADTFSLGYVCVLAVTATTVTVRANVTTVTTGSVQARITIDTFR